MRQKSNTPATPSQRLARDIRRPTRKQYSAEEKNPHRPRWPCEGATGELCAGKASTPGHLDLCHNGVEHAQLQECFHALPMTVVPFCRTVPGGLV